MGLIPPNLPHVGHVNRLGIRINTPPELILRRIGDEFEEALMRTKWAKVEYANRFVANLKRYRVVRIIHRRASLEIAAIYINVGPFTFQQAQQMVDWLTQAYANDNLYRSRNYMQEISQ